MHRFGVACRNEVLETSPLLRPVISVLEARPCGILLHASLVLILKVLQVSELFVCSVCIRIKSVAEAATEVPVFVLVVNIAKSLAFELSVRELLLARPYKVFTSWDKPWNVVRVWIVNRRPMVRTWCRAV